MQQWINHLRVIVIDDLGQQREREGRASLVFIICTCVHVQVDTSSRMSEEKKSNSPANQTHLWAKWGAQTAAPSSAWAPDEFNKTCESSRDVLLSSIASNKGETAGAPGETSFRFFSPLCFHLKWVARCVQNSKRDASVCLSVCRTDVHYSARCLSAAKTNRAVLWRNKGIKQTTTMAHTNFLIRQNEWRLTMRKQSLYSGARFCGLLGGVYRYNGQAHVKVKEIN